MAQQFETEGLGIKTMERPGAATRLLMKFVGWVEKLNISQARLGNPCVYDNALFPWSGKLAAEWPAIRRELDHLMERREELPSISDISPDAASISTDRGWKTFIIEGYGFHSTRNAAICPQTWRALQHVPGLITAMFSIFEPGKKLPPHRGPYNGVLRLHLGLIVPRAADRVGIRVGDQVRHWREGEVLIFDDAYTHETWNDTGEIRVVLFLDFVKPLRFPASILNWVLIKAATVSPFVRDCKERQRAWEEAFHAS